MNRGLPGITFGLAPVTDMVTPMAVRVSATPGPTGLKASGAAPVEELARTERGNDPILS
ncbi:hypothetical protein Acor_66290 [Acrocarpospora corrugata]|uniref:Uncharacterized protein n=1 Tax=Acrocarpospora corrugata TaxID=35763 RepID=A0A5M3WBX1_9ACTN|nr:hypothetical protein [Acrocarpospora corrugata]GES04561.1 hypothetical protein Acor_66290 [Acrocarpospora corrugata]